LPAWDSVETKDIAFPPVHQRDNLLHFFHTLDGISFSFP
jgi:hypothetical protein